MAQRASLGPKPSLYIYIYCVFCSFSFFAFNRRNPVFPRQKGHFCLFLSVSLCFSLAFFALPLFHFLFLCLSFVLVFLPSCLYVLLSFGSLFLSLSLFVFLLCVSSFLSLFPFPVLFFLWNPFFLSWLFPAFKLCFLFNMHVFFFISKRQV